MSRKGWTACLLALSILGVMAHLFSIFVVPRFVQSYEDAEVALPQGLLILIKVSLVLRYLWPLALLATLVLIIVGLGERREAY